MTMREFIKQNKTDLEKVILWRISQFFSLVEQYAPHSDDESKSLAYRQAQARAAYDAARKEIETY